MATQDDQEEELKGGKIYKRHIVTLYDIYLNDSISHNSADYLDIMSTLNSASDSDEIIIHMANFGGSVHVGLRLARAVQSCVANVIMKVEGDCYSMGAMLAVCGNGLIINPGIELMFHNYSSGSYGKGQELTMSVEHINRMFAKNLKLLCYPFLTKAEIKMLSKDQDVYIAADDPDFIARLERHFGGVKCQSKTPTPKGTASSTSKSVEVKPTSDSATPSTNVTRSQSVPIRSKGKK